LTVGPATSNHVTVAADQTSPDATSMSSEPSSSRPALILPSSAIETIAVPVASYAAETYENLSDMGAASKKIIILLVQGETAHYQTAKFATPKDAVGKRKFTAPSLGVRLVEPAFRPQIGWL
jgi:hypothetical protein